MAITMPPPLKNPETVLGELLRHGGRAAKDCLSKYDHRKPISSNKTALGTLPRSTLDTFAEFLDITGSYKGGVKDVELGNKKLIGGRIAQELLILTTSTQCAECRQSYSHTRRGVVNIRCFLCHRPAHNCEDVTAKLHSKDLSSQLTGDVWLCTVCCVPRDGDIQGTPIGSKASSRLTTPARSRVSSFSEQGSVIDVGNSTTEILIASAIQSVEEIVVNQSEETNEDQLAQSQEAREERDEQVVASQTRLEICRELVLGKCPHGASGRRAANGKEKCSYAHPQPCRPWMKRGSEGCSKGKDCKKLHKERCENALRRKECFNKSCFLAHPKGTVRKAKKAGNDDRSREKTREAKKNRERTKSGRSGDRPTREREPDSNPQGQSKKKKKENDSSNSGRGTKDGKSNRAKHHPGTTENTDFLGIYSLLEKLQKGMNDLKSDQGKLKQSLNQLQSVRGLREQSPQRSYRERVYF